MPPDTDVTPPGTAQDLEASIAQAWPAIAGAAASSAAASDWGGVLAALRAAMVRLEALGLPQVAHGVAVHLDYLAARAGLTRDALLDGAAFDIDPLYRLDAIANVGAVLAQAQQAIAEAAEASEQAGAAGVPAAVFAMIRVAERTLPGWCSREKALLIAQHVLRERPEHCVEIGVFGGRSLIPIAAALRENGTGHVHAIETWRADVAVQDATNTDNDAWWQAVDFDAIKAGLLRFVVDHGLVRQVRIVEAPSARAAALFDCIDFLHIDGSHAIVSAAEDVVLYARKLRQGALVLFDDVNWETTRPAREILAALCDPVATLTDPATGQPVCALLRRR